MIIEKIVEPYFGENIYLLTDKKTKKCAVIDPGGAYKRFNDIYRR